MIFWYDNVAMTAPLGRCFPVKTPKNRFSTYRPFLALCGVPRNRPCGPKYRPRDVSVNLFRPQTIFWCHNVAMAAPLGRFFPVKTPKNRYLRLPKPSGGLRRHMGVIMGLIPVISVFEPPSKQLCFLIFRPLRPEISIQGRFCKFFQTPNNFLVSQSGHGSFPGQNLQIPFLTV